MQWEEFYQGSVQYLTTKSKQPIKEYKSTLYVVMYQSSPVIVDSHYTIQASLAISDNFSDPICIGLQERNKFVINGQGDEYIKVMQELIYSGPGTRQMQ